MRVVLMRLALGLGAIGVLSACAASPESISASYVSPISYNNFSCADLAGKSARVDSALVQASSLQEQAHGNDVVGVLLIGVPVSTLSGTNVAPQVASLKGQQEAIRLSAIQKHCTRTASFK